MYNGGLDAAEITTLNDEIVGIYNNGAPIAVADAYTLNEDSDLFAVSANIGVLANDSDPESDPLTAVVVTQPAHGVVSLRDDGSFFYAPERNFFGVDSFTYSAVDFRPSDPTTVTLTVNPTYDPALASADNYIARVGQVLTVSAEDGILANDSNPDQSPVTVNLVQDVNDGTLTLNADGSFQYDPGEFNGLAIFRYTIDDGVTESFSATVSIRVNSQPLAIDDAYTLSEDANLTVNAAEGILANDSDGESDPLTLTLVDTVTNGTLELAADGSFSYTPNAEYSGPDQFTYRISDGIEDSVLATVSLNVQEINDVPVGISDVYLLSKGLETVVDAAEGVLANDSDVDGPELKAILAAPPNRGNLQLNDDGSFVYSVDQEFVGVDFFSYSLTDSIATSDPITVQLIFEVPTGNTSPTGDSIVTFNEIMYNPGSDGLQEWIELRNQMGIDMDISGWSIAEGVEFEFPEGTIIPGNGFLVVAANPEDLQAAFDGINPIGPFAGRLSNAGEQLELRNNSNRVMDVMTYNNRGDWPVAADGAGPSLTKTYHHSASGDAAIGVPVSIQAERQQAPT